MNRCIECNKFRKWEYLTVINFTPEFEDGSGCYSEETLYGCMFCKPVRAIKLAVEYGSGFMKILTGYPPAGEK